MIEEKKKSPKTTSYYSLTDFFSQLAKTQRFFASRRNKVEEIRTEENPVGERERESEEHRRRMEEDRAAVTGVGGASRYALKAARISSEDILICVDVDAESTVEMKTTGINGRPLIRMECVKQAIILFIHNKLSINPDHRFAFATLSKSAAWVCPDSLYVIQCRVVILGFRLDG